MKVACAQSLKMTKIQVTVTEGLSIWPPILSFIKAFYFKRTVDTFMGRKRIKAALKFKVR